MTDAVGYITPWLTREPVEKRGSHSIQADPEQAPKSRLFGAIVDGKRLALRRGMRTLLDTFEVRSPNDVEAGPMRQRMASIVIDVEWDEPPPSSWSRSGPRVWTSED